MAVNPSAGAPTRHKASPWVFWLFAVPLVIGGLINAARAADEATREWDPILPASTAADDATLADADLALSDTFTLQGVQGVARRRTDGGFDWDDRGPRNDPEWAWFFNRHGYFVPVFRAYLRTRDDRYAEFIFATLDDWIVQHPSPGRMTFSSAWRPLEAARRILDSWMLVYLKMGNHPAFTPERRTRFYESIRAHGDQLRHHHALYGNHLITEMLALAQLGLVFPEKPDSAEWLRYSLAELERSYAEQVYPDGAHTELSAHYQRVVALSYQRLLTLLEAAGRHDLADVWRPRVRLLWTYFSAVMKPNGGNPLNNDSDQENVSSLLAPFAQDLAAGDAVTRWLPYAGQAVFRGEHPQGRLWAFFDTGPRGTDHDHADRLHFSLSVGERDFLVDNGRYTYRPGAWRDYFAGPTGHNVVLFDAAGSDQGPQKITTPNATGRFFATDHVELAYGDTPFATANNPRAGDWRRIVVHLKNQGLLVVDRIVAFQPATLQTLWHWSPDCIVSTTDAGEHSVSNGPTNLDVRLASNQSLVGEWSLVRGSVDPVQGWHSTLFNIKTPAPCTLYTQRTTHPLINVWFFAPQDAGVPKTTLAVTFEPGGAVLIRTRSAGAGLEISLDPQHPEAIRTLKRK